MTIDSFKKSFYYLWFSDIPDDVLCKVIEEVESQGESKMIKSSCSSLYQEWVIMNVVVFLLTFFKSDNSSKTEIVLDGENSITLNSLSETGVNQSVRKDSIDSNITRDYYEAKLPEGMDFKDFPYGRVKERILYLKDICKKSSLMFIKTGLRR